MIYYRNIFYNIIVKKKKRKIKKTFLQKFFKKT
nr:MAG TPA: hypothetical protein [Caudoviricetes sp.]